LNKSTPHNVSRSDSAGIIVSRTLVNRILIGLALLAIVIGLKWGQAVITWLNATILCLSCIGIQ